MVDQDLIWESLVSTICEQTGLGRADVERVLAAERGWWDRRTALRDAVLEEAEAELDDE